MSLSGATVSLLVAVLVAGIAAAFVFPYRFFLAWYSWGRSRAVNSILAFYVALTGAGGGFLGWIVAQLSNANPTGIAPVDGVLYGIVGAVAIRADLRPSLDSGVNKEPTSAEAVAGDQMHTQQFRSFLGYGLQWVRRSLDEEAFERANAYFSRLSDAQLNSVAWTINARISQDDSTPARGRTTQRKLLLEMLRDLGGGTADDKAEARAQLRLFIARYCIDAYLTKKTIVTDDETAVT